MSVKMTDGKHVRKIHIALDSVAGCGHVWMFAPYRRVHHYSASWEGAERNLVRRMERKGWRVV